MLFGNAGRKVSGLKHPPFVVASGRLPATDEALNDVLGHESWSRCELRVQHSSAHEYKELHFHGLPPSEAAKLEAKAVAMPQAVNVGQRRRRSDSNFEVAYGEHVVNSLRNSWTCQTGPMAEAPKALLELIAPVRARVNDELLRALKDLDEYNEFATYLIELVRGDRIMANLAVQKVTGPPVKTGAHLDCVEGLVHGAFTLSGSRHFYYQTSPSPKGQRETHRLQQVHGDYYLTSSCAAMHGSEYALASEDAPMVAVQARMALTMEDFAKLHSLATACAADRVEDARAVYEAVAKALLAASGASGEQ